jgi:3-oxoacyl-[acyl-carrier-protein] synthase III
MSMPRTRITGIGTVVPEKVLTNQDLELLVDTSDEWIVSRTGIRERRIVDGESTSDLAAEAGRRAMADAGLTPADIDLLILTTSSPEMIFPSTACLTQPKIGLTCPAFDVMAACSGTIYGLTVADAYIRSGVYKNILFIGSDVLSRHVDYSDRGTCILFGDGAGAFVLSAGESGGILGSRLFADGTGSDWLKIPAGGSAIPVVSDEDREARLHCIKMEGKEIFKFATRAVPEAILEALGEAGLTLADVDFVVPHQANQRIIDAAADRLGLVREKMISNISRYGNTSTASIPIALEELVREGRITPGMIVVLVGFGAGLTAGASVIEWTEGECA